MLILPLAAAVTVLFDGRPVLSYAHAYIAAGRTYAPLAPYVTRFADRMDYEGKSLIIRRGERMTRLVVARVSPDALDREYVAIAPVLRSLGASVSYDAKQRLVEVVSPGPAAVQTPRPFDANAFEVAPHVVFTPTPIPQAPFVWRGPAIPRRTPLPYPEPT